MPIVSFETVLGSRQASLGPIDDGVEPEAPPMMDLAEAAFRQNNIAAGGYDPGLPGDFGIKKSFTGAISRFAADMIDAEENYDPLTSDNLAGYEQFADRFIGSASGNESARVKFRIDAERKDQELIARAGGTGLAASIAAGVLDPITLASMLVPAAGAVGTGTRGARILSSVGRTAALDVGQEMFLHSQQELRTASQSAINISAGTLLSGAFGTLATRVPKSEFDAMINAAKEHTEGLRAAGEGVESTAGAARAGFGTTLEDETVAKGGEALLKTAGKINPLARVMQASSKRARILMQELADVPFLLNKHMRGIATPQSAEGEIKAAQADVYRLIKETDSAWIEHKASGGTMKRGEFSDSVAGALRRGDVADDPAVAKAAQNYRRYFDQSRKDLQDQDLIPDPVKADQARLETQAVEKYAKAEGAQIFADYSARTNSLVQPAEFRRLLRSELDNRGTQASKRAAVSEAPAPIREFAESLQESAKARGDISAQLESKLSTINGAKEIGIGKADAAMDAARRAYREGREGLEGLPRDKRTIAGMKLRATRDDALRAARKLREKEARTAADAASAARKEASAAGKKIRDASQEARAKAVKAFQSASAVDEKEFVKRAEKVLRTGEEDLLPEVNKLADLLRKQQSGDLVSRVVVPKTRVTQAPTASKSYLPRVYDHQKIRANRKGLEEALRAWFSRQSDIAPEELNAAVADVIDTINGALRNHAQISPGFVGTKGSLKSRTLNVPDEILEPWLVNNVEKIFEGYVRTVQPQLVLKKRFGDLDMRQQMQDVRDEYVAMREAAPTNAAKAAIDDEMKAVLEDIQAVRDLHFGKLGTPANPDSFLVRAGRVARTWNYVRSLGGQVMSSFPDAGRVMARHGLVKTGKTIARLVSDSNFRNLSKEQAHKVGTALEYVLNTRADTLGDIGNELLGSRLDRFLRRESNRFSRLTGMASWNSALKTLAVALEQDAIVSAAKGGRLSKFQKGQLANLGMGERMLERVRKEITDNALDIDGLFRANTEKWADTEAASAFEQALLKSADQVVLTKGVADTPLFMATEVGKTLFQFKSFGMASVNRMLIPMSQGVAHGDLATINGGIMMLAIGAMANAARDWAAGYAPQTDPARIAVEAFDRAGFTGFMSEPYDAVAKMTGLPSIGRFKSTSLAEQILGPAVGGAIDITNTAEKVLTESGEFDPQVSASDVYRFRKLIPYQNLFYLRRLINAIEGEFSEGVGAEGAGSKSFSERLTESKTLNAN